jgi:small subunit ribosomal protein S6
MTRSTVSTAGSTSDARRAREYETIYIMRPNVSAKEADRVAKRLMDVVGGLQGKLLKLDSWGWRRLAYPIKGETRGVFIYARYAGYDDLVAEIERNLRLLDPVVRFQTVLLNPRVNMDEIQVDPADIALEPLGQSDLEEDISIAQRLGLIDRQAQPRGETAAAKPEQQDAAEPEQQDAAEPEQQDAAEPEQQDAAEPEQQDAALSEPQKASTETESEGDGSEAGVEEPKPEPEPEPSKGEENATQDTGEEDRGPEAGTA